MDDDTTTDRPEFRTARELRDDGPDGREAWRRRLSRGREWGGSDAE